MMYAWLRDADLEELPVTQALHGFLQDPNLIVYDHAAFVSAHIEELTRAVYGLEQRLVALERE